MSYNIIIETDSDGDGHYYAMLAVDSDDRDGDFVERIESQASREIGHTVKIIHSLTTDAYGDGSGGYTQGFWLE